MNSFSSKAGVVVIVLAVFSVGQLLFFSYQNRQIAECIQDAYRTTNIVQRQRADIFEADRTAFQTLIKDSIAAETDKDRQEALDTYLATSAKLDKQLENYVYPDLNKAC